MKNKLGTTVVLVVLLLGIGLAQVNAMEDMGHCSDVNNDGVVNGNDHAQHVSMMAKMGMLGKYHNPGMHKGFSDCLN